MSYNFIKIPLVHSREIYRAGRWKSIKERQISFSFAGVHLCYKSCDQRLSLNCIYLLVFLFCPIYFGSSKKEKIHPDTPICISLWIQIVHSVHEFILCTLILISISSVKVWSKADLVWKYPMTSFFIQIFKSSNCGIFQGMSWFLQPLTRMGGRASDETCLRKLAVELGRPLDFSQLQILVLSLSDMESTLRSHVSNT